MSGISRRRIAVGWLALCSACQRNAGSDGSDDAGFEAPRAADAAPQVDAAPTFALAGTIAGAGGVTVAARGPVSRSATTDARGEFRITDLRAGTYTVSPTQPGFTFTPARSDVTLVDRDIDSLAFERQAADEGLSAADLERIDSVPDSSFADDEVILPNGQTLRAYAASRGITADGSPGKSAKPAALPADGPQQTKNDLVTKMVLTARWYACGRADASRCTIWDHDAGPSNPNRMPAQTGLTYVYGGTTPFERSLPVDSCPEMTYGMDCSGMVYRLAVSAGIALDRGSAIQEQNPDRWVMPPEWKLKMKEVTSGEAIETGDIIGWPGHIGIAEVSGGAVNVISATGAPGMCAPNVRPPRGPRSLALSHFGTPTTILRLVTTLSGDFDTHIRCADASTDAALVRFTIDNDNGGPFTASGSGTDYNGEPLCFGLRGTYDQITNVVSATLALCDGSRSDGFDAKLLTDDTGYFALSKVSSNGGCAAEVRLVRVQQR